MTGILYGLSTAATWGLSNVFLKSQVGKLPTKQLLALRAVAGLITAIFAYLILGKWGEIAQLNPLAWLALIGVVLSGYFGADLLFVYALEDLPVSHIFPIQATYPLVAAGLAWYIFGDMISAWMLLGAVIVITGISLISSENPGQTHPLQPSRRYKGYAYTVLSALGWGISAVLLRVVLENYDPVTTNLGVALITALFFLLISRFNAGLSVVIKSPGIGAGVGMAGALGGIGFSNLLFIIAVQIAGVASATVLASLAPLFTSFFAVIFLRERLTSRLTLGTIFTVIGVGIFVGG
jgi:drug/metabolite transporter (DMT)-like permease